MEEMNGQLEPLTSRGLLGQTVLREFGIDYGYTKPGRRWRMDWIVSGNDSGGDVVVKSFETIRSQRADLTEADGVVLVTDGSMVEMYSSG